MNKQQRYLKGKEVAERRARNCGWRDVPFDELPERTKKAFRNTGNIALNSKGNRKGFGKSKRCYGHFSGYSMSGFPKNMLIERAINLSHDTNPLSLEN